LLAEKYGIKLEQKNYDEDTVEAKVLKIYEATQNFYSQAIFRPAGNDAYEYFNSRKLTDETMQSFGLGYSPKSWDNLYKELRRLGFSNELLLDSKVVRVKNGKFYDFFINRAMFPIKDFLGRTIAFGGRQLVEDKAGGKYINSEDSIIYDKKQTLFFFFFSKTEIRKKNEAIIVEGYIDVLSLYQAGIKNVVAPCGTALSREQLQTLKKHTNANVLYFMFDGDIAGINASIRGIEPALELGFDLRIILLPKDKDPDSIINDYNGFEEIQNHISHYYSFVDFISKKFSLDGKLTTPAEKSAAIKNIISYILKIPDKTQHKFYIDNIREIFDIELTVLRNIYYEVQQELKIAKNKKLSNTANSGDLEALSKQNYDYNSVKKTSFTVEKNIFNIDELLPAERKIIQFALQSKKYFSEIIENYNVTVDTFISELAKMIFEIMNDFFDVENNFVQEIISSDDIPNDVKSIISHLTIEKIDNESSNWKKFGTVESETSEKALIGVLLAELRTLQIDSEVKELQKNISVEDKKILLRIKELLVEKKQINETVLRFE
jgi:DNA primase